MIALSHNYSNIITVISILLADCLYLSTAFSVTTTTTTTRNNKITAKLTKCWGKYRRYNKSRKIKLDTDDILAYERSLINDRGFSYIIGSDETGRGSIAGPVMTASCCILTLANNDGDFTVADLSDLPTVGLITSNNINGSSGGGGNLIKDSKQLSPDERERIYEVIVNNPQIYAFSVAQRSNTEIDGTNNILTSTMECFKDSTEELAQSKLFPYILSRQQQQQQQTQLKENDNNKIYSVVDGKKAPKLLTTPSFPCRPMVKADVQVYTVALASIIAKVTLDRMADEWHNNYPEYNFQENKGYATRAHIEAIHRYGPCPLHRMTFKSLKGR